MPPPTLYHYTSQDGLIGIVGNKEIWASNAAYLNDTAEFMYFKTVLKQQADGLKPTLSAEDALGVDVFIDVLEPFGPFGTHVCSFSENGDLLSQWRGYCAGGAGYSIGFSGEYLEAVARARGSELSPCIYDLDEQNAVARKLLMDAIPVYREHRGKTDMTVRHHMVNHVYHTVFPVLPRMKHPSYAEEREWRLIFTASWYRKGGRWLFFRPGKSMLVPYFKIKLFELEKRPIITRVIVGPTSYPELSIQSVRSLLYHIWFDNVDVITSVIPYRP